jgi:hypothetical protein
MDAGKHFDENMTRVSSLRGSELSHLKFSD